MSDDEDEPRHTRLYELLQVKPDAEPEEIRASYRRLALQHHPDKKKEEEKEEAIARFQEIAAAYKVLSDPEQRQWYDEHGEQNAPPAESQLVALVAELLNDAVLQLLFAPFETLTCLARLYHPAGNLSIGAAVSRAGGLFALWRGTLLSVGGEVLHTFVHDTMAINGIEAVGDPLPLLSSGTALLASYPLLLLATVQRSGALAPRSSGILDAVAAVWRHRKLLGFYSGFASFVAQQVIIWQGRTLLDKRDEWIERNVVNRFDPSTRPVLHLLSKAGVLFVKASILILLTAPLRVASVREQVAAATSPGAFIGSSLSAAVPGAMSVAQALTGFLPSLVSFFIRGRPL